MLLQIQGFSAILGLTLAASARPAPLVYSTDRQDPWNVIHGLLQTEAEGQERSRPLAGWVGDDAPDFFFKADRTPPRSGAGRNSLLRALANEARAPEVRSRSIEARLLFQQDLWKAFDHTFGAEDDAEPLRGLLGNLLVRLTPTDEQMAGFRSNLRDALVPVPGLDESVLKGEGGWRELRAVHRHPDGTTLHAARAGYREIFRVLVDLPPGTGEEELRTPDGQAQLPRESRVVLLGTLVGLLRSGELTPVPLVVGLEMRHPSSADGRRRMFRAAFHVSRLALSQGERGGGGLRAIPEAALVRGSLNCYPFEAPLEPLGRACDKCHGPTGGLSQTGVGGPGNVRGLEILDPRNTREPDAVLRRKAASREFMALQAFFSVSR